MPNHCTSRLTITGKPKQLHKLLKQVEITQSEATDSHEPTSFSCHKIIPRPVEEDKNWYEWSISNWGTKWDLCDIEWINKDWEAGYLDLEFWTAWSPIPLVLEKLSQQNKSVEMTYRFSDEGGDFYGTYSFKGGVLTVDEEGNDWNCDIKTRYGWGEEHHCCKECSEYFTCPDPNNQGNLDEELCPDCKTSLEEQEKDLWEEATNENRSTALTV